VPAELALGLLTALATSVTAAISLLRYRKWRKTQQRAYVRAELIQAFVPNRNGKLRTQHQLRLVNDGPAAAQNIRLLIDGQQVEKQSQRGMVLILSEVPQFLEPKAHVSLNLALTIGGEIPKLITVIWDDLSGVNHSYSIPFTL